MSIIRGWIPGIYLLSLLEDVSRIALQKDKSDFMWYDNVGVNSEAQTPHISEGKVSICLSDKSNIAE